MRKINRPSTNQSKIAKFARGATSQGTFKPLLIAFALLLIPVILFFVSSGFRLMMIGIIASIMDALILANLFVFNLVVILIIIVLIIISIYIFKKL